MADTTQQKSELNEMQEVHYALALDAIGMAGYHAAPWLEGRRIGRNEGGRPSL